MYSLAKFHKTTISMNKEGVACFCIKKIPVGCPGALEIHIDRCITRYCWKVLKL